MLRTLVCYGLQSGDPNCKCVDVEVPVGAVMPATVPLAEGWAAPTVRVTMLSSPHPGNCRHTMPTADPLAPDRLAENAPRPVLSSGLDVLVERTNSLGLAIPQETIHAPGLSLGTVSPSLAPVSHTEPPPSHNATMSYAACAGITHPLSKITGTAQQMAGDRAKLLPCGEHTHEQTVAPSKLTLVDPPSSVSGETTRVRFGGSGL